MSAAGAATFNNFVTANRFYVPDAGLFIVGGGGDLKLSSDGTNGLIETVHGNMTLDVAGEIHLDSDSGIIRVRDGGGDYGMFQISNSDLIVRSMVQDKDLLFKGNDGGSAITALTLDMSAAGNATFNGTVLASNGTASLPSLSFSGDSNTGIYRLGSDNLGFAIGGQARAFMSATQFNMTGNGIFSGYASVNALASPDGTSIVFPANTGYVGIGTGSTAPASRLHVLGNSNLAASLTLHNTAPSTDNIWRITPFYNSGDLGFLDDGTERMRIDSSGNVLVGKTASNNGVAGVEASVSGGLSSTVSGDTVSRLNRLSSDGEILRFQKDTATVGSIGTQGGDLNIGTGACGIAFVDGVPALYPWTTTGNTTRDAAIDLGDSGARFKDLYLSGKVQASYIYRSGVNGSGLHFTTNAIYPTNETAGLSDGTETIGAGAYRFKDLYLSGGVYLGGTGAANKLDDFEFGTWTLTDQSGAGMSLTVYVAEYTKIGNKVFFEIGMAFPTTSSTADLRLSLPFTAKATSDNTGGAALVGTNSGRNDLWLVNRNNAWFGAGTNLNIGCHKC